MTRKKNRPSTSKIRMQDVAQKAGFSAITVSRAIKSPNKVSSPTKEKIEQAMIALGYVPNLIASGLASNHYSTIAIVVPFIRDGIFSDTVQGINDAAQKENISVLLGSSGACMEEEERIVKHLLGHKPAGIVLHGGTHTDNTRTLLRQSAVPTVEVGVFPDEPIDMVVGYSNVSAAHRMTQILSNRGCQKIAIVSADTVVHDRADQRVQGYRRALSAASLQYDPRLHIRCEFGMTEGRQALIELLNRDRSLDGVFCTSDIWAAGMIFECHRKGISIPKDIAICGFNNQEIAQEIVPSLTTVQVNRYEMGVSAAKSILARRSGNEPKNVIDVGYQIKKRESA
ncbi:LacI family DNA-binding transcriptional regulator [Aquibaculum sediminis]|uniref:LacI family DNA-binding transcriptional regulator n=1 Tax=Aquibaculum sediminis TaxID=3231907 RepID=UPI0034553957